jgi:hypothetical protein
LGPYNVRVILVAPGLLPALRSAALCIVRPRKYQLLRFLRGTSSSRIRICRGIHAARRGRQFRGLECLGELLRGFPSPICRRQTDNGTEFPLAFALAVQEAGIRHRYLQPKRAEQNGKVERSHWIDADEFWGRHVFEGFDEDAAVLQGLERVYDRFRFSMALAG